MRHLPFAFAKALPVETERSERVEGKKENCVVIEVGTPRVCPSERNDGQHCKGAYARPLLT